jgi:AcrR family transcriptional regulator
MRLHCKHLLHYEQVSTRPYHHGDLRAALIDGAVALITEQGPRDFSLAELSRRVGVTGGAPYRHFASRDDLLAAVAVRALRKFDEALAAETSPSDPPERRLSALAAGYVRFAARERALFSVVFDVGLDKKRSDPELREAHQRVEARVVTPVAELCPGAPEGAERLADAIEAVAHGYATLLLDEPDAPEAADVERAASQAAAATLALIRGRDALLAP